MKKALLFLLVFSTALTVGYAQAVLTSKTTVSKNNQKVPGGDDRMIHFDGYQKTERFGMSNLLFAVMDTRIFDVFNHIKGSGSLESWNKVPGDNDGPFIPRSPILLGVKHTATTEKYSTYHVKALSKEYIAYKFADKDSATALAAGINPANVKDYWFRVLENDSVELIPWTIPTLQQKYGAKKPYAYLGKFHFPGKEITIEVINIKNYGVRDGVVFNWDNLKPVISKVQVFTRPKKVTQMLTVSSEKANNYAKVFDKATGAPIDFHFPADSVTAINICFKNHPTMGYDIVWDFIGKEPADNSAIKFNFTDSVFFFDKQYFDYPGKYRLLIYPSGTRDKNQQTVIYYEVTGPREEAKFSILQILPYFVGAILIFIIYYLYNRRRLRKLARQKEMANLKLSSVRAQLNPHFMFNALTSIQNLMNQQDSEGANHYLAKFADLTRQVLNATGRELISLEDELKIINDYLQIEQLRFGFKYKVDVDKSINIANTEIPGMLMQPFIENAAKHGISGMLDKGKIGIAIAKKGNSLLLIITDNGKGFDTQQTTATGFGLKLGRERVALLNQVYKNQPIDLQIDSNTNGTTITITLTAWF
jgi:two-component system LytT family sensor kinase